MKTSALLKVYSYHHNNTEKIAGALANAFRAEIKHPGALSIKEIDKYDLVGFGAGIDRGKHYAPTLELVNAIPHGQNKKAFIFSTSGIYTEKKMGKNHKALRNILLSKGYSMVGEFSCAGLTQTSYSKHLGA